jgi:hypothetical protein
MASSLVRETSQGCCRTSPLELKQRMHDQSSWSIAEDSFQALTMEGITPSMVTRAQATNSQKLRPVAAPRNRPIAALFSSAANISQGPIIQPRLVGQHTKSRA